ncbi:hypothetical protein JCM10908_001514 [Rhodotorula pacifica]|uniref:uncharacterized protein n=1 Tax=Rhodotorula pacifica TaxID=1495444 RepID=UPI00316D4B8A
MSVRATNPPSQRGAVEAKQTSAPTASSSQPQQPRDNAASPSQPRKRTSNKPRRTVVRRRGARVDSESEQDELDRQQQQRQTGTNVKSRDSDSGSDLDLPSSDDDDDDSEDDDADDDGFAEPKTPATASVEQLPQSLDTATPRQPLKSRKAVLAGQVMHPSWSDMPAPGEEGDTSLPTLDFSNLSLDVVQHLPSPPPRSRPAAPSTSKATATPPIAQAGGLTKKQLQEQKRQAKLAALKEKDPEAAERIEQERQEHMAAKRLAKKERMKEKKRERKLLEKAAKEVATSAEAPPPEMQAVPTAPAATASSAAPSVPPTKAPRPPKAARPAVPSRPSRTAVALGLLGPDSPSSSTDPAPSALPASASATTPIVPAATRQPAFLPRDAEGRPIPQSAPATRSRSHHSLDDEHAASQWVRGRGGAPRGFGSYRGRGGAGRSAQQDRDDASPQQQDMAEEEQLSGDSARFGAGGYARGRGRGRGTLARGGFAGRGRGAVTGPPGSINPRYAHLPFHPLHRFPSLSPDPRSASPAPSNRSSSDHQAPPNPGPEVTTASPDEQLFDAEAESAKVATGVVKLPERGPSQVSISVKGAAAAQAAARDNDAASKENRPPAENASSASNGPAQHKLSDPGILYASAPRRPTEEEAANQAATAAEARPEPLSLMHQVPPHLQASAGPSHQHDATVDYQPQSPYSVPYWSSEASEPYPISAPSPAPSSDQTFGANVAHPPPSSAYFVPPRPSKRVEIKNPSSRDGQSPAPSSTTKSAPPAPVDALEAARGIRDAQILQHQEQQRQAEASYMHAVNYGYAQQQHALHQQQQHVPPAPDSPISNRGMFASSPTFTRDSFSTPANAPLPPAQAGQHQPQPAVLQPFPASQMYPPYPPAHVMAPPPPQPAPTTYELVAPYPSHYPAAAAYYAPQQPMYQHNLSPPVGAPAGYYGVYGGRPVAYEEQQQWSGY